MGGVSGLFMYVAVAAAFAYFLEHLNFRSRRLCLLASMIILSARFCSFAVELPCPLWTFCWDTYTGTEAQTKRRCTVLVGLHVPCSVAFSYGPRCVERLYIVHSRALSDSVAHISALFLTETYAPDHSVLISRTVSHISLCLCFTETHTLDHSVLTDPFTL